MLKKEFSYDDLERVIAKRYKNIAGIVVVKDDNLVYENYFNGYGKEDTLHVASVTKSVLSALIGIAIDKGFIESVNQKVLDFFPEYDNTLADSKKQEVTIKHFLTMTAPYIYKREPFRELCCSPDWAKYALDLLGGKDECGTFKYSTAGAHLLSVILTKVTGKTAREFANEYLFAPIGMKQLPDYEMTIATYMNFVKGRNVFGWVSDPKGYSTGGWGATLSTGDMARFGQLYLNYGKWNGRKIISREWIEESLQDNSNHYGYLWWLFKEDEFAYCAMGDGGNVICCLPERNMVVAIASTFMMRPNDRIKLVKDYILPLLDKEKIKS